MRKRVFSNQMSIAVLTVILLSSVHRACGEYYAYDGRRNNLQHPEWGLASFVRLQEAKAFWLKVGEYAIHSQASAHNRLQRRRRHDGCEDQRTNPFLSVEIAKRRVRFRDRRDRVHGRSL